MLRALLFLLGAALLAVLVWQLGPADILHMIGRIGWQSLPILVFFTFHQAARAAALKLSTLRSRLIRYRDALWIRFSGEAMQSLTFTGPFLAEPVKAWLLERQGLTLTEGFAATITEYLVSLFVGAAMCVGGLCYLLRHGALPSTAADVAVGFICTMLVFLLVAAIAIHRRLYLIGTTIAWLGRRGVLRGRLRPSVPSINRMESLLLAILRDRPWRFAAVVMTEVAGQLLLVLEVFWILRALALATPAVYPLVIEAATKFISVAFFFVPLQMGAAEGTYAMIFSALGLPAAAGLSLAFVRRVRSLLVATAGLAALNALTRNPSSVTTS